MLNITKGTKMSEFDHVTPAIRLLASNVSNPDQHRLFSIRDRTWHPRSYFDTNTRGCIIPDDVVDIESFILTPNLLQVWRDCQMLEMAFYKFLMGINPHSQWFRPCSTIYEFMSAVHIEARQSMIDRDTVQRTQRLMSPQMLESHWVAYQLFLLEYSTRAVESRTGEWSTTHFTIGQFTFPLVYVEGTLQCLNQND